MFFLLLPTAPIFQTPFIISPAAAAGLAACLAGALVLGISILLLSRE